jgi:acetyl esterase
MAPQLDPEAEAVAEVAAAGAHLSQLPVEQARERARAALVTKGAPLALHGVQDVELPSPGSTLRLRLYRREEGRLPVALFLHGGGWTINDLDTHDALCRRLARRSGWLIASLDYRRAPEHPHPAQLEDALLAHRWLADNAGSIGAAASPPAVIGESSGATTAAGLTLLLRDLGAPLPAYQVLAYPATDRFDRWPSYAERAAGYILDRELMRWYFANLLPGGDPADDPYLYPLTAGDLSGLPPALVLTAEFDPLRDEGIEYVGRLRDAGVAVEHVHAEDQMHGFLLLGRVVGRAGALIDRTADALGRARRHAGPRAPT